MRQIFLYILLTISITNARAQLNDWQTQYNEAKSAFNQGDFSGATSKLTALCEAAPKDYPGESWYEMNNLNAICLLKLKKYQESINAFTTSLNYFDQLNIDTSKTYFTAASQFAVLAYKIKKYDLSTRYFSKSLKLKTYISKGQNDKEYITLLSSYIAALKANKNMVEADSLYHTLFDVYEKANGRQSAGCISTLRKHAALNVAIADYEKAEKLYADLLLLIKEVDGVKSQNFAEITSLLVDLYKKTGHSGLAEALLVDNLKSIRKTVGENDPLYLNALLSLANAYRENGNYVKARSFYKKSEKLILNSKGDNSIEYTSYLNDIGILKEETGDFQSAIADFNRSLDLRKTISGNSNEPYANTLSNLANTLEASGDYIEAEKAYLDCISLFKAINGENHPNLAMAYNNYAVFLQHLGRHKDSYDFFLRSSEISKNYYGKEHINYITSLLNIGAFYDQTNQFSKALRSYEDALNLLVGNYGNEHPLGMSIVNNLGKTYLAQNQFTKAEEKFLQLQGSTRKKYGKKHPKYALVLLDLARLREKQGSYGEAIDLYDQALKLRMEFWQPQSEKVNSILTNLARVYESKGDVAKSFEYWEKSIENYLFQIKFVFPSFSEKEKLSFYQLNKSLIDQFCSFVFRNNSKSKQAVELLFKYRLETKGLLFQSVTGLKQHIENSNNSSLLSLMKNWEESREYLTSLYLNEKGNATVNIDSLTSVVNRLEKDLISKSGYLASIDNISSGTWNLIKDKLSENEVAIELIRFTEYLPKNGGTFDPDHIYYLAIIIEPGAKNPQLKLMKHGTFMESRYLKNYWNSIDYRVRDLKSYEAYFKDIIGNLGSNKTIYFSPDGVYHQINPETVYNPFSKKYLIDDFSFQNVTNLKEAKSRSNGSPHKAFLLMGNPDFTFLNEGAERNPAPGFRKQIKQLPGAEQEIEMIDSMCRKWSQPSIKMKSNDVTEQFLKNSTKNYRIVHLATHGFFKRSKKEEALIVNPLLQSGLLLAKANESKEDGILYSFESMNLNLKGCDLVVLSACETGLGKVQNGEGVYGMQRSIRVAGANNVLISLWKVDDAATNLMMQTFYNHLLTNKSSDYSAALREAQNVIRNTYPDPYYWGAFVISGR